MTLDYPELGRQAIALHNDETLLLYQHDAVALAVALQNPDITPAELVAGLRDPNSSIYHAITQTMLNEFDVGPGAVYYDPERFNAAAQFIQEFETLAQQHGNRPLADIYDVSDGVPPKTREELHPSMGRRLTNEQAGELYIPSMDDPAFGDYRPDRDEQPPLPEPLESGHPLYDLVDPDHPMRTGEPVTIDPVDTSDRQPYPLTPEVAELASQAVPRTPVSGMEEVEPHLPEEEGPAAVADARTPALGNGRVV